MPMKYPLRITNDRAESIGAVSALEYALLLGRCNIIDFFVESSNAFCLASVIDDVKQFMLIVTISDSLHGKFSTILDALRSNVWFHKIPNVCWLLEKSIKSGNLRLVDEIFVTFKKTLLSQFKCITPYDCHSSADKNQSVIATLQQLDHVTPHWHGSSSPLCDKNILHMAAIDGLVSVVQCFIDCCSEGDIASNIITRKHFTLALELGAQNGHFRVVHAIWRSMTHIDISSTFWNYVVTNRKGSTLYNISYIISFITIVTLAKSFADNISQH